MGKFSIRTVFAYDWPLTLAGMEHVAGNGCAIELVGVYRRVGDMVAALGSIDCDVVLVDYAMRGDGQMDALQLLDRLRASREGVGVVVLVTDESPVIVRSILAHRVRRASSASSTTSATSSPRFIRATRAAAICRRR